MSEGLKARLDCYKANYDVKEWTALTKSSQFLGKYGYLPVPFLPACHAIEALIKEIEALYDGLGMKIS